MTSPLLPGSAQKEFSTIASDTSPYPIQASPRSLITGPGRNASLPPLAMTATLLSHKKVGLFSSSSLITANSVFLLGVHII
jgi:hypothetical protein